MKPDTVEIVRQTDPGSVEITVGVPIYNEGGILDLLHRQLREACDRTGRSYEILFVNDGSTDASRAILGRLAEEDPHVTIVDLSRNFGHPAAFTAAVDLAAGNSVIVLDGDLQDDPGAIPDLLRVQAETQADVVYVVRGKRAEPGLHRLFVQLFNWLLCAGATHPFPANVGNYSLLGPRALRAIRQLPERLRYFPGLRAFVGFRQVPLVRDRGARYDRRSRLGFPGLVRLAAQAFFAHTRLVPTLLYGLGVILLLGGAALLLIRLAAPTFSLPGSGIVALAALVAGLVLFAQGLTCDLLTRVYREVSGRPAYLIDRVHRAAVLAEERSLSDTAAAR